MSITINSGSLWGKGTSLSYNFIAGNNYIFTFTNTEISASEGGSYFTMTGAGVGNSLSGNFSTGSTLNQFPEAIRPGRLLLGSFIAQSGPFPTSDTVQSTPALIDLDPFQTAGVGRGAYLSLSTYQETPTDIAAETYTANSAGDTFSTDGTLKFVGNSYDGSNKWVIPKATLDTLGLGTWSGALNLSIFNDNVSGRRDPDSLKGAFTSTTITSSFVENDNRFSCFIDGTGDQSFTYVPTTSIPFAASLVQGTGHYTLTITP